MCGQLMNSQPGVMTTCCCAACRAVQGQLSTGGAGAANAEQPTGNGCEIAGRSCRWRGAANPAGDYRGREAVLRGAVVSGGSRLVKVHVT